MTQALLKVEELKKYFQARGGFFSLSRKKELVHAVDNISFVVDKGQTFSLVGETGSGKTTVARLIMRLIDPDTGNIIFEGENLTTFHKKKLRAYRREAQMIFQDPFSSLNPRKTILEIVGLPLEVHKIVTGQEKRKAVIDLLEKVGLAPGSEFVDRYPHEFSGGQRQRIGIARALSVHPKFIVADEPVSALDVSVRAQVLNLMRDLQRELDLTYLLISHDLSVVRHLSDSIAVMYFGKIVEQAASEDLFTTPLHPYTMALLSSVPIPDPDVQRIKMNLLGSSSSPIDLPSGCRLRNRCPYKQLQCEKVEPSLIDIGSKHLVACHFPTKINT